MPPTEPCILGTENRTKIDNLKEDVNEFKESVVRYMDRNDQNIAKLTNCYSNRPTWFVSLIITSLVGLVIFLTQYIITQL